MDIFHTTDGCLVKGIGVVLDYNFRRSDVCEVMFVAVDKHENLKAFERTDRGTYIIHRKVIAPWNPSASEFIKLSPTDDVRDPYVDAPDFPYATLELPIEIAVANGDRLPDDHLDP